jgi:hypothetical protein
MISQSLYETKTNASQLYDIKANDRQEHVTEPNK